MWELVDDKTTKTANCLKGSCIVGEGEFFFRAWGGLVWMYGHFSSASLACMSLSNLGAQAGESVEATQKLVASGLC